MGNKPSAPETPGAAVPAAAASKGFFPSFNLFGKKEETPSTQSPLGTAPAAAVGGRKRFHKRKTHRKTHSKKGRTGRKSTRA